MKNAFIFYYLDRPFKDILLLNSQLHLIRVSLPQPINNAFKQKLHVDFLVLKLFIIGKTDFLTITYKLLSNISITSNAIRISTSSKNYY